MPAAPKAEPAEPAGTIKFDVATLSKPAQTDQEVVPTTEEALVTQYDAMMKMLRADPTSVMLVDN